MRDFDVISALDDPPPGAVMYMDVNQLDFLSAPKLPYRNVEFFANATYMGDSKRVRVELFLSPSRPNCPVVASGRPGFTNGLVCDGPAGGRAMGEFVLTPHVPAPFSISGAELDNAVRRGVLYLGVRVLEGRVTTSEYVEVRQVRARGRL